MISLKKIKQLLKKNWKFYQALRKDKRIPWVSKAFLWMALAYLLMPFDLIPDFIPVLGQLDDLIIVPGLIYIAVLFVPKEVYTENYSKVFGKKPK